LRLIQKRILCVADNEGSCLILTTWLKREGHRVLAAAGPEDALRRAAAVRFELIVVYQRLPGEVALRLCTELRTRAPETPVLFISSIHVPPTREQVVAAGAQELLVDDGDDGKLVAAVLRLTDGRGA